VGEPRRRRPGDPDLAGNWDSDLLVSWWRNDYQGTCDPGLFHFLDGVRLEAVPDEGWFVGSWSGTDDDGSLSTVNQVTMPGANHAVSVDYVPVPNDVVISGDMLTGAATIEACETILVGEDVEIGDGAAIVLRAPSVLFLDDVSVTLGATLTVDNGLPGGCPLLPVARYQ
jgi:hypothetical protein